MHNFSRFLVAAALISGTVMSASAGSFEDGAKAQNSERSESEKQDTRAAEKGVRGLTKGDDGITKQASTPSPVSTVDEAPAYGMYALGLILMGSMALRRLTRNRSVPVPRRRS